MKSRKILILLAFAAVVAAFYFLDLGKYLTLESLKANRALLTDLRVAQPVLFAAVFVLVYIVQTAFSLPGRPSCLLPPERSSVFSRGRCSWCRGPPSGPSWLSWSAGRCCGTGW